MIRATVEYSVKFQAPVLPGSGHGVAGVDRAAARTMAGPGLRVPYIPGSHLRGVVREKVEHLARLVLGDDAVKTIAHVEDQAMRPDLDDPVARLFVSGGRQGLVVFRDLLPSRNDRESGGDSGDALGKVAVRARVSIDRRTGTQRGQRLFDHETWHPAGRLAGRVDAWLENEDTARFDLALLVGGLRLVDALGANRSAGLGACRVDIDKVLIDGEEVDCEALLEELGGRADR